MTVTGKGGLLGDGIISPDSDEILNPLYEEYLMATIKKSSILGENVTVTMDYDDVKKTIVGIHYNNGGSGTLKIESMGDKQWTYTALTGEKQDINLSAAIQPSYSINFLHCMTYGE